MLVSWELNVFAVHLLCLGAPQKLAFQTETSLNHGNCDGGESDDGSVCVSLNTGFSVLCTRAQAQGLSTRAQAQGLKHTLPLQHDNTQRTLLN